MARHCTDAYNNEYKLHSFVCHTDFPKFVLEYTYFHSKKYSDIVFYIILLYNTHDDVIMFTPQPLTH